MKLIDLFFLIIFCFLIVATPFSLAQQEMSGKEAEKTIDSKSGEVKDRVDCRKVRTTSSRIKRKICLKESQWKRIEDSSQLLSRELYSS